MVLVHVSALLTALCSRSGERNRKNERKVTSFGLPLKIQPESVRKKSTIQQLSEIVHRLVKTNERREGLIFQVTLQSAHIWPIKEV